MREAGFAFALLPVGLNSLLLVGLGIAFNNLAGSRYPHRAETASTASPRTSDQPAAERTGFSDSDVEAVLDRLEDRPDIEAEDLASLLRAVEAVFTEPGHEADETTLEHEVNAEAGAGGCFPFETLSPDEIGVGNPSPTARFQLQRRNLSLAPGWDQKCAGQEDQESRPMIYTELWDNENRSKCIELLAGLNYLPYIYVSGKPVKYDADIHNTQNFLFLPN